MAWSCADGRLTFLSALGTGEGSPSCFSSCKLHLAWSTGSTKGRRGVDFHNKVEATLEWGRGHDTFPRTFFWPGGILLRCVSQGFRHCSVKMRPLGSEPQLCAVGVTVGVRAPAPAGGRVEALVDFGLGFGKPLISSRNIGSFFCFYVRCNKHLGSCYFQRLSKLTRNGFEVSHPPSKYFCHLIP